MSKERTPAEIYEIATLSRKWAQYFCLLLLQGGILYATIAVRINPILADVFMLLIKIPWLILTIQLIKAMKWNMPLLLTLILVPIVISFFALSAVSWISTISVWTVYFASVSIAKKAGFKLGILGASKKDLEAYHQANNL